MEFHISRRARDKYQFDEDLFAYDGNVIFANFLAARKFTHKINALRDLVSFPEQAAKTSQLNAMGLIDEIFHHIFKLYREQKDANILRNLVNHLEVRLSPGNLDAFLELFIREFPPPQVYKRALDPRAYLQGQTSSTPNRELLLEELVMLWLEVENPALGNYQELFNEKSITSDPRYAQVIAEIRTYFDTQPFFGPRNTSLITMLRSPALEVPDSITGQLEYIRDHWAVLLGEYLFKLLSGLDLIKEENKLSFTGPGVIPIPVYDRDEFMRAGGSGADIEAFSMDKEWMPKLVLIAKNSYVWLDQLSRKYNQEIRHLDQIPDAELETLARWGITGLWLIGLWERSPASARIKQLCGNPEAISSAYSLYSYQIANDLGGESAYESLRDQAARYGIRLASDMVPNHMGIDSEWMIHNPERFLSLDQCPYPSYSFNGENLSTDPNILIQIEDHYFDRTDAAVVFKRQDLRSGQIKYVYHGNDGTTMPWNDTAQLNYLNPEAREAVIQTILSVARKFPIVRFDAAMTLAKKHFQRLWFPQPGTGGAIPSRAEHAITQEEFNRAMPVEFWREVVDRVAVEAPDTLLLAEAFWLMEGYFVRTLGMHRVYNSAFMNMLRNEDNVGYRKLIRNTLEFEPEILKRYVNFMNNPDERTAVDQFGKGDKYFGICILMATLPGLPMLGHGQIEGFAEKYGMEFRKAYWDEKVDPDLVSRHEWEIFPLLHERRLFAGVEHFNLYDFVTNNGSVNENVYAYSNHENGSSALVIYNNNIHETEGWIRDSIPQLRKHGNDKQIESFPLGRALFLPADRAAYVIFRDQVTRLQYLRPLSELLDRGLHIKLRGYQYHAFLDFRVVHSDPSYDYRSLYGFIGEQGVPDIEQALCELVLRPVQDPYRALINPDYLGYLLQKYSGVRKIETMDEGEIDHKVENILRALKDQTQSPREIEELRKRITSLFINGLTLEDQLSKITIPGSKKVKELVSFLLTPLEAAPLKRYTLLTWALCSQFGQLNQAGEFKEFSNAWLDEFQLAKPLAETLREAGMQEEQIQEQLLLLRLGISQQDWYDLARKQPFEILVKSWLAEPEIQAYLRVNRYQGILWYNHEAFESFTWWMSLIAVVSELTNSSGGRTSTIETILNLFEIITSLKKIESRSEYKFEKLADLIR
jgi:glycosidase